MSIFVLAKNEEANIGPCLDALRYWNCKICVLDSGSSDATHQIVQRYTNIELRHHNYQNHCETYNTLTTTTQGNVRYVMILDADMSVTDELRGEIIEELERPNQHWDVLRAPVRMFVDGQPLSFGSMYPPKPFLFRAGKTYFEPVGHGERLFRSTRVMQLKNRIIHNDRKDYSAFLASQYRYATGLHARVWTNELSSLDAIRVRNPLIALAAPLYSLFVKGGVFAGRLGWKYALDRLIAECIMFRVAWRQGKPPVLTGRSPHEENCGRQSLS